MIRIGPINNSVAAVLEQIMIGIAFFLNYGILVRVVGTEQVGIFSLVLVIASLGSITSMGFASAISHFLPIFASQGDRQRVVLSIETTVICTLLLYTVTFAVAYFPVGALIEGQIGTAKAPAARGLMPVVVAYAITLGVGGALGLALTALQRLDLRFYAALAGGIVGIAVTAFAAPRYGVIGGAYAFATQGLVTLALAWVFLRRLVPELPIIPLRLDRPMAKRMVGLGMNMQAQSMLFVGLEPLTRLLIGHFGSLTDVTIFAMASRFVLQVRALIFAPAQPLIAWLTALRSRGDHSALARLYGGAHFAIVLATLAMMSALFGAAPFVGEVWIGVYTPQFTLFAGILAAGWLVNTISLGPYFNAYSLGKMSVSLVAHVAMFLANIAFGLVLSPLLDGTGAVVAMALALALSGIIMLVGNARHVPETAERPHRLTIGVFALACLAGAACAACAYLPIRSATVPMVGGISSGIVWLVWIVAAGILLPRVRAPARAFFESVWRRAARR